MKQIKLSCKSNKTIGKIEPTLFGSFVEHMGRCMYHGMYEPSHPRANEAGFREDVMETLKEMGVSIVRYPGGNFVSQYQWKHGIGPKGNRPVDLNLAWHELEPNQVGVDEFVPQMKKVGAEMLMSFNLGSGDFQDVNDVVQYCNLKDETYWAQKRIENGNKDPYGIKYWCLGNEMDGFWQVCHMCAEDYAKKAISAAQIAKLVDPSIKCILAGSHSPYSPTWPIWDKTIIREAFDWVDYLAIHCYFTYPDTKKLDVADFLGSTCLDFSNYVAGARKVIADEKKRRKSDKDLGISIDEWNVWHTYTGEPQKGGPEWSYGNHIIENNYDFADSLAVAGMLITMMNNCDAVKIACLAQMVNVIAPILTENDGRVVRQSTFYPFSLLANSVKGAETLALEGKVPTFKTTKGKAPELQSSICRKEDGSYVLTLVNLNSDELEVEVELPEALKAVKKVEMSNKDLHAKNTFDEPGIVKPVEKAFKSVACDKVTSTLKPYSLCIVYLNK